MKPLVRMVCGDCLRSVELEADDLGRLPTLCPVCGGTIDSRLSEMETPTSNFALPTASAVAPTVDNRWNETWTKGSLGTVGRFQLRELLGDGGFGQVYQAYDPRLDRDVALKVLRQANPGERVMQRFFREARAAARLSHPNIVPVLDAGTEDGRCWIAYEYVNGRALSRQIDQQRPELVDAVLITRALADALDHAHRQGVFHRDLKPANVIVDTTGQPHLIDFGLARRADLDSDLTRDGTILGTPGYMSPEQQSGRSHLADERSDVFSLGVMLFELVCGERPFEVPSDLPAWQAKPTVPPPSPRSINPDVPVGLEQIVMKALAIDPEGRFPNARSFVNALEGWLDSRRGLLARSHPLTIASTSALGALIVGFALFAFFARPVPARPGVASAEPPASARAARLSSTSSTSDTAARPAQYVQAASSGGYEGPVMHTSKSLKFHPPGCSHLSRSVEQESIPSVAAALERGLEPCELMRAVGNQKRTANSGLKPAQSR